MTEGLTQYIVTILLKTDANTMHSAAQSLRVGLRRPTSLYTREALVRCNSVNDYVENYFFYTLRTASCEAALFYFLNPIRNP